MQTRNQGLSIAWPRWDQTFQFPKATDRMSQMIHFSLHLQVRIAQNGRFGEQVNDISAALAQLVVSGDSRAAYPVSCSLTIWEFSIHSYWDVYRTHCHLSRMWAYLRGLCFGFLQQASSSSISLTRTGFIAGRSPDALLLLHLPLLLLLLPAQFLLSHPCTDMIHLTSSFRAVLTLPW